MLPGDILIYFFLHPADQKHDFPEEIVRTLFAFKSQAVGRTHNRKVRHSTSPAKTVCGKQVEKPLYNIQLKVSQVN